MMEKIYFMVPIFVLYNFESLEDIKFKLADYEYLKNGYDINYRNKIYSALQWAEKNPGYDFKSIMNDAPTPGKLKFSNKEVYTFLMSFKKFMENEEYSLLNDDRPTYLPWEKN